ncbi:chemotaxis protein CheW [Anaeromyxobacter paludicola]|uniref:Chemotaxis protein CheW n=1 Tax=Anaeromyxobacter paludicola TaxID=2918171 RepID=A0ABM7XB93_9BACT|nr:chemotaxis protein CheW [Anaeromyxobacter paludicola]BDG09106.1 chemotaxis protein CheW [Anaeromyxobacter paludicola]
MDENTSARQQYLAFGLAEARYGVELLKLREILQLEPITKVPGTPPSVRGVINLRGAVVPVVDLALKFGLPETVPTRRTCVLVVESALGGERAVVGLLADSVDEVVELGPGEVEPAPAFGTRVRLEHLRGMGKLAAGFLLLLDIDRILSDEERDVAAAAEAGRLEARPPAS